MEGVGLSEGVGANNGFWKHRPTRLASDPSLCGIPQRDKSTTNSGLETPVHTGVRRFQYGSMVQGVLQK